MSVTGQRLRLLREERKWSQEAVAERLGISRTAYNKYENGAIRPMRKLKELADLFGVSADYILGGADDEQSDVPAMHRQMKKYMELRVAYFSQLSHLGGKIYIHCIILRLRYFDV